MQSFAILLFIEHHMLDARATTVVTTIIHLVTLIVVFVGRLYLNLSVREY